jgi:hypothetical protein
MRDGLVSHRTAGLVPGLFFRYSAHPDDSWLRTFTHRESVPQNRAAMNRLFVSLAALAVSLYVSPPAPAQSPDYFPMSPGNSWTYGIVWGSTLIKDEGLIIDTAQIAGKVYYLYTGRSFEDMGIIPLAVDTLWSDSLGRIWRLESQKEYMLFDFSVDSGGSYISHTTYPMAVGVKVKQHLEVIVPAGHFTNCVDLYFTRAFSDENGGYTFAPGVGLVQRYGPFIGTHVLLRAVIDGRVISSTDGPPLDLPARFALQQNYPNPFNPSTTISYALPKSSEVRLSVFDILGREVSVLVNERRDAGVHEVKFDAAGLVSGVYFYRLHASSFVDTKKLLLIR